MYNSRHETSRTGNAGRGATAPGGGTQFFRGFGPYDQTINLLPFDMHLALALTAGEGRATLSLETDNFGTWTAFAPARTVAAAADEVFQFLGLDTLAFRSKTSGHAIHDTDHPVIYAIFDYLFGQPVHGTATGFRGNRTANQVYVEDMLNVGLPGIWDSVSELGRSPIDLESSWMPWARPGSHTLWTPNQHVTEGFPATITAYSNAPNVELILWSHGDGNRLWDVSPVEIDRWTAPVVGGVATFYLSAEEVQIGRYELRTVGNLDNRSAFVQGVDTHTLLRSGSTTDNIGVNNAGAGFSGAEGGIMFGFTSRINPNVQIFATGLDGLEEQRNASTSQAATGDNWIVPYGIRVGGIAGTGNDRWYTFRNLQFEALPDFTFEVSFQHNLNNVSQPPTSWQASPPVQIIGPYPHWRGSGTGARPTTEPLAPMANRSTTFDIDLTHTLVDNVWTIDFSAPVNPRDFGIGFNFSTDFTLDWNADSTQLEVTFNNFEPALGQDLTMYIMRLMPESVTGAPAELQGAINAPIRHSFPLLAEDFTLTPLAAQIAVAIGATDEIGVTVNLQMPIVGQAARMAGSVDLVSRQWFRYVEGGADVAIGTVTPFAPSFGDFAATGYYVSTLPITAEMTATEGATLYYLQITYTDGGATQTRNSPHITVNVLDLPALPAPTGLAITGTMLTWTAVSGSVSYAIYVDNALVGMATGNSFNLATLNLPYGEYLVQVRALGDGVNHVDSPLSAAITFEYTEETDLPALPAPTGLAIVGTPAAENVLTWNAVSGSMGYMLYVGGARVTTDYILTNSFDLATLNLADGIHQIQVRAIGDYVAYSSSALSAAINFVVGDVQIVPLPAPTNLVITGTTLTWNTVANAVGYTVYVDETSVITTPLTVTSFNLAPLDLPVGTHPVQVRAIGDNVAYTDSLLSVAVNFTVTDETTPPPPPGPGQPAPPPPPPVIIPPTAPPTVQPGDTAPSWRPRASTRSLRENRLAAQAAQDPQETPAIQEDDVIHTAIEVLGAEDLQDINIPGLLLMFETAILVNDENVDLIDGTALVSINIADLQLALEQLALLVATLIFTDGDNVNFITISGTVDGDYFRFLASESGLYGLMLLYGTEEPSAIAPPPTPEQPPTPVIQPTPAVQASEIRLQIGSVEYLVDGVTMVSEVAPFIDAAYNRTMVPLRLISEALGATVTWTEETRTVTITQNGVVIPLQLDTPLPDGMGVPTLLDGRTFVPAAYVGQMLGATITWDAETQAVYITP